MLNFATKTLSTGANGQKEDAAPPFVRAELIELSCGVTIRLARASLIGIISWSQPVSYLDSDPAYSPTLS